MKFIVHHRLRHVIALSTALSLLCCAPVFAQTVPGNSTVAYSQQQLETLVGRIALYPDDLIAITLPASTYPLDVVKAQRFLDKLKYDSTLKPDASMADPVVKLLNYPEVIKLMNDDLDWTQALGDAVDANETGVMQAVQSFRLKAQTAGNLRSDDKQTVAVDNQIVTIVPANPEVIYVPVYQPASVIVYSPVPYMWGYYPTPYPSYYYPYSPGGSFSFGFIWGAAIGSAWNMNWYGGHIYNNVTININNNYRPGHRPNGPTPYYRPSGGQNWRNNRPPTQTHIGIQARQPHYGSRPGDPRPNDKFQGTQRPNYSRPAETRPATTPGNRPDRSPPSNNGATRPAEGGSMPNYSHGGKSPSIRLQREPDNAFNGVSSSGNEAIRASSRGMTSRPASSQNFSRESNAGQARPNNNAKPGNERR
jgi:hypothetical protein